MAAISVTPQWSGMQGSAKSDDGRTGTQDSQLVFEVVIDDPVNDDDNMARAAVPIVLRQPHPNNFALRCNGILPVRTSLFIYMVTCTFASPTFEQGQQPPDVAAKIRYFTASGQEKVDDDVNGAAILNAVGDPFDPIEVESRDLVIEISRAQWFFDDTLITTYLTPFPAVLSDMFLGKYPVGTVKVDDITADSVVDDIGAYFQCMYRFRVRRGAPRTTDAKAWWVRLRNEGLRAFYDTALGAIRLRIVDDGKQFVTEPRLLKANGRVEPDPANANWLLFELFPSLPSGPLGIW